MASLAQDTISGRGSQARAHKAPLSTHPAFPFIVALWFAALLGIGSLVVPVPVIERLVEVTGLAAIIPQTAPPLGFTARALIALACTVGGALTGLVLARKVAAAHRPRPAARFASTGRKPISAHDELGADGFDGPTFQTAPRGRRTLAIAEEEGASEVFELAPLPGRSLPLSALDHEEVEALELADAEMLEEDAPEDVPAADLSAAAAPLAQPGFTSLEDAPTGDFVMTDRRQFSLEGNGTGPATPPSAARQQFFVPPEVEVEAAPVPEPEPEQVEVDAPAADLHFSPPSLARPFGPPVAQDPVEESPAEPEEPVAAPAWQQQPTAAAPEPAAWQEDELDDLALVQLAQRLGSSIARRREARAAAAAAEAEALRIAAAAAVAPVAPVAPVVPAMLAEDFDAAEAAEAAQAMAAYFGAPARATAEPEAAEPSVAVVTPLASPTPVAAEGARQMFQPIPERAPAPLAAPLAGLAHIDLGEDDEDEDDGLAHIASFSLPLARAAAPVAVDSDQDEAEEPVQAPAPAPFANPFLQRVPEFVRIENEPQPEDGLVEPAVVFPGELAASAQPAPFAAPRATSEENERALREALLNLQRMSGAA